MPRARSVFVCTECGTQQPRWLGRCPGCGAWQSLVEEPIGGVPAAAAPVDLLELAPPRDDSRSHGPRGVPKASEGERAAIPLRDVSADAAPRTATGIGELDRVLGGGLVPGSVILIGGEPGIGKSTLCLQLALAVGSRGRNTGEALGPRDASRSRAPRSEPKASEADGKGLGLRDDSRSLVPRSEPKASGAEVGGVVLYVTGEESLEQVRLRAARLGGLGAGILALAETRVEALARPWRESRPSLVLIDSIQTLRIERIESAPGSVAQVRECAALLAATAKTHGTVLVLVGHVTKEGTLAGPRVLEHLVDVVLEFEGDRSHSFRLLRAAKNRFGSTQEVGVFTMGERGLEAVENPSELFLAERHAGAPGSCIVPVLEGSRPMLLEVQALVAPAGYGTARRTCLGIDDARVALLLAVLDRRSDVDLLSRDVYVNVAGGVKVTEPAADLALALAIASSRLDVPLPSDVAACGEVGLGGEIRRVARLDERLREAVRLGYRRVLVPARALGSNALGSSALASGSQGPAPATVRGAVPIGVDDVGEAVAWLRSTVHADVDDR